MGFKNKRVSFRTLLFWLGLWLVISLAFLLPKTADWLAQMLGLEKGADIAIYSSILLIFYLLFKIFTRLEKIETEITSIARDLAFKNKDNQNKE